MVVVTLSALSVLILIISVNRDKEFRVKFQSGADAIGVGAVVVVVTAIGVDIPGVVGVVGVRGAQPPVGGRYESYPNTRRVSPPGIQFLSSCSVDYWCSFRYRKLTQSRPILQEVFLDDKQTEKEIAEANAPSPYDQATD